MLNALSIDVEDYYHVSAFESVVRFEDWHRHESRVEKNTHRILELLDPYGVNATFFVLGWVAERYPGLVREISARGHEVASHGYSHQRIYRQSVSQFREETKRSKKALEDIIGKRVNGYRAASYSITQKSLWALDILREEGFIYDSSIFPVYHDLYGIPGSERFCHVLKGSEGRGLVEMPLSTLNLAGVNIPVAGGGYLRLFPYSFIQWAINRLNKKEGQPAVIYLHPWEFDPDQPRIKASFLSRFRQYLNLRTTEKKFMKLVNNFTFGTIYQVLIREGFLAADRPRDPSPGKPTMA